MEAALSSDRHFNTGDGAKAEALAMASTLDGCCVSAGTKAAAARSGDSSPLTDGMRQQLRKRHVVLVPTRSVADAALKCPGAAFRTSCADGLVARLACPSQHLHSPACV